MRPRKAARLYVAVSVDEDPGDGSLIRAALNDFVRMHNLTELAIVVGMSRVGMTQALAEDGNPSFATMLRITRTLDMQLKITV